MSNEQAIEHLQDIGKQKDITYLQRAALAWVVAKLLKEEKA